jgi:betaine-aldehyde dehydrogenase/5-carboxymethyl-2-hydroxymuconic-semialdehyde dehydrogenase
VSVTAHDTRVEVAGVSVSTDHYIGGKRVPSAERFETRSPIDWSLLADVSRAGAGEVAGAVAAAASAFPAWAELGTAGRAPYLYRLAEAIDANVERIALVECHDMAMLHRSLEARVIPRGARNFRLYADHAQASEERDWRSLGTWNRVQRMPAGPAAVITPWNAPFMLATGKTASALAAGCTVVLKPAEWAPLTASLLVDLIDEVGFPPGVFNLVQGIGEEAGAALVADPAIRRISFTGSPETGRLIAESAARNLAPFLGELGGKSPFVVFDDADVEAAAANAVAQFDDAGQSCHLGTRLLVQESVAERFLERFHEHADAQVLGEPFDAATTITPLIHRDHLARVDGFVERARSNGDRIVRGGARAELGGPDGLWYEPTLVEPRSNDSEIVQREVFGPVLCLQTFASEADAIELANATEYGLAAVVFTGSAGRAERVGRAIRAGTVWVNCFLVRDLTAPFGGIGRSGIGRQGASYSLDFYSDLKTLQILEGSTA